MNPEELFNELKDPAMWNAKPRARAVALRARRVNPLVISFASVAAIAVVAIIILGVFSSSIRAVKPPLLPPAQSPTPAISVGPSYDDDGRVAEQETYGPLAGSYTATLEEVDPAGLVSVPWVAIYPFAESTDLYLAAVGGAPDGADGVTPAATNDGDACWGRPVGANVVETETSITITVYDSAPTAEDCTGEPEVAGGEVLFSFPMKDRKLIHGGLSEPWTQASVPIATEENPYDDQPTPEETTPPVLQDDLYVTSEGLGDIRIGEPLGSSSVVTWVADYCGGTPGDPWAGGWTMNKPFDYKSLKHIVADVVTADGVKTSPIDHILISSPEIPTKSGARVGDTLTSLKQRFPDLGEPVTTDGFATYAIPGTKGKVLFDVGEKDSLGMGEVPNPEVLFIRVIPIDADPTLPIGDTYGSCHG